VGRLPRTHLCFSLFFTATRLVVTVTPATSISFLDLSSTTYAPIGADGVEMPLTVLSALARLDVDPWTEAAELSELPKGAAAQRLASLIARLPGGRWTLADSTAIADRLVELLPSPSSSEVPFAPKPLLGLREMTGSAIAKVLLCAVLGFTALILLQVVNLRRRAILLTRRPSAQLPRRRRHQVPGDDHLTANPKGLETVGG
jgi:hypothetical protein